MRKVKVGAGLTACLNSGNSNVAGLGKTLHPLPVTE